MTVSLDHINISVKNYDKVLEFYRVLFGLKEVESGEYGEKERWSIMRSGDFMMCIYESNKRPAGDVLKVNHFAVKVSDEKIILKNLERLGIEAEPYNIVQYPHSQSWYVKHPRGHGIEIVKDRKDTIKFS